MEVDSVLKLKLPKFENKKTKKYIPFIHMANYRYLSKQIGPNHTLALNLWKTGIHEARILSSIIDIPAEITENQMETWVREFDSWNLCDLVCIHLFSKTVFAYNKAIQWSYQGLELVKRAGFVLMATYAKNNTQADDEKFYPFLMRILDEAEDSRNLVKRAINSSLYEIGKRNQCLKQKAFETILEMTDNQSESARWIAKNTLCKFKRQFTLI